MNVDVNFSHADWNTISSSNEYEKAFIKNRCSEPLLNPQLQLLSRLFLCNNLEQCNLVVEANSFSDHNLFKQKFLSDSEEKNKSLSSKNSTSTRQIGTYSSLILKSALCQTDVPMTCYIAFIRASTMLVKIQYLV